MTRVSMRWVSAAVACCLAGPLAADVHMVRKSGGVLIFNDVGSGWTVNGKAPSDAYLLARKNASTPFDALIHREARTHGVDPALVKSVMLVESNYNPRAVSRKGARGLMQLMPATARQYGVRNSFEPAQNIRGGVRFLSELLQLYSGDVTLALAAYNAGASAVARYGGVPPYAETREYVRRATVAYSGTGAILPRTAVPKLGGGFRGQEVTRRAPVRVDRESRLLSNTGEPPERPAPILGRVSP